MERETHKHTSPGGPGPALQRRGRAGNPIALLVHMITTLNLGSHPGIGRRAQAVLLRNDERGAEALIRLLAPLYWRQRLSPDHFPEREQSLAGEFLLGPTPTGTPLGLTRDDLPRHVFLAGQPGTGKTTLIKNLVLQAREQHLHAVFFDRKGDSYHLVREGLDVLHWSDLRRNPLCPPLGTSLVEWRNDFAKLFSESQAFMQRGASVFLMGLHRCYERFQVYEQWPRWDWATMTMPTLIDLYDEFRTNEFRDRVKGRGRESLYSILDKIESMIVQLEPVITCRRGVDVARLYRERPVVACNLDGLTVEYQNTLIITELLQYAAYFRTFGPWNQANVLFFFDESHGLLGEA